MDFKNGGSTPTVNSYIVVAQGNPLILPWFCYLFLNLISRLISLIPILSNTSSLVSNEWFDIDRLFCRWPLVVMFLKPFRLDLTLFSIPVIISSLIVLWSFPDLFEISRAVAVMTSPKHFQIFRLIYTSRQIFFSPTIKVYYLKITK